MFWNKSPYTGILAFVIVLLVMPLGHILMILVGDVFGEKYQYPAATLLGLLGLIMLFIGVRNKKEATATWLGFFAGQFIWTGWVEFSFVFYAAHLDIKPIMENGEIVTKPEYLIMPSSIGLLLGTLLLFFFNKDTRCNFFKWFHRNFKMKLGSPTSSKERNITTITALETIYITWFFYVFLLLLYDERIIGDRHPITYVAFYGFLVWAVYLFFWLIKYTKISPAVRYAIPTVIIFWNSVEILGRWGFFTEFWVYPKEYVLESVLILGAFIGAIILNILTPKDKPERI